MSERRRRIDLFRGTAFGLFIGIMGNLFVQFLSPVIEATLLGEYKSSFAGSFIVCAITLISIIAASSYFYWQQTWDNRRLESTRKNPEIVDYAIRRRQYDLEHREEQQPEMWVKRNSGEN